MAARAVSMWTPDQFRTGNVPYVIPGDDEDEDVFQFAIDPPCLQSGPGPYDNAFYGVRPVFVLSSTGVRGGATLSASWFSGIRLRMPAMMPPIATAVNPRGAQCVLMGHERYAREQLLLAEMNHRDAIYPASVLRREAAVRSALLSDIYEERAQLALEFVVKRSELLKMILSLVTTSGRTMILGTSSVPGAAGHAFVRLWESATQNPPGLPHRMCLSILPDGSRVRYFVPHDEEFDVPGALLPHAFLDEGNHGQFGLTFARAAESPIWR